MIMVQTISLSFPLCIKAYIHAICCLLRKKVSFSLHFVCRKEQELHLQIESETAGLEIRNVCIIISKAFLWSKIIWLQSKPCIISSIFCWTNHVNNTIKSNHCRIDGSPRKLAKVSILGYLHFYELTCSFHHRCHFSKCAEFLLFRHQRVP